MNEALRTVTSLDPHLNLRRRPPCHGRLACDLQALSVPEFTKPLVFGVAALAFVLAAVLVIRQRDRHDRLGSDRLGIGRPIPLAGPAFTLAALAGYWRTGHLVPGLGWAVAILAAAGLVIDLLRLSSLLLMLFVVPGAIFIGWGSAIPDPTWAKALAAGLTLVGAALIRDFDRRCSGRGLGPVLLAAAMICLYETVPDPDFALILVGVAVPLAFVGWPVPLASFGGSGAAAAAGLFAWADAVGGRGRLSTVVAGAGCLGLLAIEPLARILLRGRRTVIELLGSHRWEPLLVVVVQLALGALFSRIPGWAHTPLRTGVIVGGCLAFAVTLMWALSLRAARDVTLQGDQRMR